MISRGLRPMRDALLDAIWSSMSSDPRIFFVAADFGAPTLDRIREHYPDRFVNVGIAEQNLINISTGLALEGHVVFAYAIAPFITMRCYEQIRVNLALLSQIRPMNVNLIGVGAGCSYVVSGPTHQCFEDLTIIRALPNVEVFSPSDDIFAAALSSYCLSATKPKYLRLDAQVLPTITSLSNDSIDLSSGFRILRRGTRTCLIATGYMVHTALAVADSLTSGSENLGVVDMYNLTSFSNEALEAAIRGYDALVTLEEGFVGRGGLDALMFDFLARQSNTIPLLNIGIENTYHFELGNRNQIHERIGIGIETVKLKILSFTTAIATQTRVPQHTATTQQ